MKYFILIIISVMFGYFWAVMAHQNQAIGCDELVSTNKAQDGLICEVFIRPSQADEVKRTNKVTPEQRI